jgi:N-acetyl-anhydromuramyl-L-alanine amidase AmpD
VALGRTAILLASGLLASCSSAGRPGDPLERSGDEISICGRLFHAGTPVVLWNDPGGYDAYRIGPRFPDERAASRREEEGFGPRYGPVRGGLPEGIRERVLSTGWNLADLREVVDLFVLHYDVCGTSRQCFKVLQDVRRLSVHFLLDADGTIYQTLDLKERAWHATVANDRSVGVEIAHIGAYPSLDAPVFRTWYGFDEEGLRVVFPEWMAVTGIRTPGFVPRPSRQGRIAGAIHGRTHWQHDFTDEQYAALARLTATLSRVLPRIRLDFPRDERRRVRTDALSSEELSAFSGVLGHYHVTTRKTDPGPAFDWERLLREAKASLGG